MTHRRPLIPLAAATLALPLLLGGCPTTPVLIEGLPLVRVETTVGNFTIETRPDFAPITTQNFLDYVSDGFYVGTLVHRVDPGFVIQAGGFTAGLEPKEATRPPIQNESRNGLSNARLTVAMARTTDPDSATTQFFINLRNNPELDATFGGAGFAVFARISDGSATIDAMAGVDTEERDGFQDVPVEDIVITAMTIETGPERIAPEWEAFFANYELRVQQTLREIILTIIQFQITG